MLYCGLFFFQPGSNGASRFIICRLVKNFLIADAVIKDNYTKFCGLTLVPTTTKGGDKWEVSLPTNGEIRNCRILNANSGYGLCQLHGAQSIYFRNIYVVSLFAAIAPIKYPFSSSNTSVEGNF